MSLSKQQRTSRSPIDSLALCLSGSYQSMINNNITALSTASTGSSASNSSAGSMSGGAPISLAAANVVRGIMGKVLATPPMGSGLSSSSARLFTELDYLSSPGLDSDFGDASPLLGADSSSNLSNQYLRLGISSSNSRNHHHNRDASNYGFNNQHTTNFLSR